ncbi:MAG: helix-turn-helix transcriptional regulator [Clostridia bacterium]|nr:helix-turn-helix transcriptional regulator [Clostridia bacterium]
MNNKTTGAFICQRRKELSLNQKQLADKLGVTDKAVSKWETGRSAPDISLLVPLSEVLGVSVVEILQGEKVEEENFTAVSDEVVVKTMKKDKNKLIRAVVIAVTAILSLIFVALLSYPAYHYFTSASLDNEEAVLKEISKSWAEREGKDYHDFKIVKAEKKAKFYFYLFTDGEKAYMAHCEKDPLYENRISFCGGTSVSEPNEVGLHGCGQNYMTFNIFFGYGMTDTEYSYYYRGVKSTKPIEDEYFMDVLIDVNDDYTWANIIYND